MSKSSSLELRFKNGGLKELHKRRHITREELDKAIKTVNNNKTCEHVKE
ncbi:MAG: hypothetical protein FWH37_05615 [Candidatus Bathyarchaeota archaeon]|nr:hypothetical protein [Candidatus Termiticorpusculum sp.]